MVLNHFKKTPMPDILARLTAKKHELDALQPLSTVSQTNLSQWYAVELTYTSNALEGNTLSRAETALAVEKGLTSAGKTVREHLEAINHARAFSYIESLLQSSNTAFTERDLLELHRHIMTGIDDQNAGRYRSVPVRIAGSRVILPNPLKVSGLMTDFIRWLHTKSAMHPATLAAEAHFRLVTIHPFTDGNGRTARLLMNLLLMQAGYPPAIIRVQDRRSYLQSLEQAQLGGSIDDYLRLIYEATERSLDITLRTARSAVTKSTETQTKAGAPLMLRETSPDYNLERMTIGQLARETDEPVPTIRYWTKLGLLEAVGATAAGYQLYSPAAIGRAREIRRLQKAERYSLAEIKTLGLLDDLNHATTKRDLDATKLFKRLFG